MTDPPAENAGDTGGGIHGGIAGAGGIAGGITGGITPEERPVFVLGCAWRCGSTLLQRALSSGPDLFVWGENGGMSAALQAIEDGLADTSERAAREWEDFRARGAEAWIACVNPPFPDSVREAFRGFYLRYFTAPTRALGRARWGFKEVRHGARTAAFLADLFPACRIVFLLRNPAEVVASMATMSWYGAAGRAEGVLDTWLRNTTSLMAWRDPRVLVVRYERLASDLEGEMARVAMHVGVPVGHLDLAALARPARGFKGRPALGLEERRALCRPEIVGAAAAAGYDVLADARAGFAAAVRTTVYLRLRALALAARRAVLERKRAHPAGPTSGR